MGIDGEQDNGQQRQENRTMKMSDLVSKEQHDAYRASISVNCKDCRHNIDDAHTSTCRVSGVTTRKDYRPTICYGYEQVSQC